MTTLTEAKFDHGRISEMDLAEIQVSHHNDTLYRPINTNDPDIIELGRRLLQMT